MTRPAVLLVAPLLAALIALPATAQAKTPAFSPPAIVTPEPQAAAQRLHVLADPVSRSVTRRMVTVIDAHPGKGLTFTWSPAPGNAPGVDLETGLAAGPGRLTWRIPGLADYDPRAIHHRFDGSLSAGLPHGPGEMRFRDGTVITGHWVDGLLQGPGSLRDARGNRFEGAFVAGRAQGPGRFVAAEGWVYDGPFRDGRPDGAGRITRPGGLTYEVIHEDGAKTASNRPHPLPDPQIGGLLPAQGGSMADRTLLALTADARIAAEQESTIAYLHGTDGTRIEFFTSRERFLDLWDGTAWIDDLSYALDENVGWADTFVATRVDLHVTDGGTVALREVALEVAHSEPHLRPMLRREPHRGCRGLRPSFHFENMGWGPVEAPRITLRFVDSGAFYDAWPNPSFEGLPGTRPLSFEIDPFDIGTDVDLRPVLRALGVDLDALERSHFDCSAHATATDCLPEILNAVDFGHLAPFVGTSSVTYQETLNGFDEGAFVYRAHAYGILEYRWADARGGWHEGRQAFDVPINLAVSERRTFPAVEGASGGAFPVAAPDFLDVELPVQGRDFHVSTRPRGNPNLSRFAALFRLHSAATSFHAFTAVARFEDGSERRSLPATLFFLMPRLESFTSQATPASCLMPPLLPREQEGFGGGQP